MSNDDFGDGLGCFIIVAWILGVLGSLAFTGFLIWAIWRVVEAYT